jgi:RimJ/RimL family protein N-acetyltransferase
VAESQVDRLERIPDVELSFRPMTLDDLPAVVRWQGESHVAQWWYDEGISTLADARSRYGQQITGASATRMWVLNVDGRASGYLQAYRVGDYPDYASATGEPDAVAFDYLIGEPELTGKGLGTRMIWEFMRDVLLSEYRDAPRFLASPDHRNAVSLRVLDKCGFTRGAEVVVPPESSGNAEPATEVVCTLDRVHWFG